MIGTFDERILGSSEFVEMIRAEAGESPTFGPTPTLGELVSRIAAYCDVPPPDALLRHTRIAGVAEARSLVGALAVGATGYSGAKVARTLHMSRSGGSSAVEKRIGLFCAEPGLRERLVFN